MKTVWVNGCFDVLHRGHIELFKFAKSFGKRLVVGIDSDQRVREHKGTSRPFNTQKDRKFLLEAIKFIDTVVIFKDDSELSGLIELFKPDVMVVGSDWRGKKIVGGQYAKKIEYFERIDNYSTTQILERK
tara:strand:- start:408 stop:797 length:390 start_codon:yes stop_codon:yes gene_type:complete